MVHETQLSAVLSEFARTLTTDFPIQMILDHLVARIVDLLPVTAAGVTLIAPGKPPRYIAASDADALRYERLQTALDEGPCLAAYRSGAPVSVPDLATDDRFTRFGPPATAAGLAAVFTFPLRSSGGVLGALDLYRDTPGALSSGDMSAAQTLADVAVAYLLNAEAREEALSASERFRQSSLHDPLTGLPNRVLLQERVEHAAQRAQRSDTHTAVLFADLDGFKGVNDTHGHQVGDELLLAVAQRLSRLVRPGDTLCRYAGDEFVFLCEDLAQRSDAELLAERVNAAFAEPFHLSGLEISVTASVGLAFSGPGGDVSDLLVIQADTAMYQAKRRGGATHQVIDLREAARESDQAALEGDLRTAFARGELAVAYQPIVRSTDGLLTGVEALLRWDHPVRGPISPAWVIDVAERSELIIDIGRWVLTAACEDHAGWPRLHDGTELELAVNVSARQVLRPAFLTTVEEVLEATGLDPTCLVLELTEHSLIEDTGRATTMLSDLRALGIRIALDDFGTGYSSLSYLETLPIDILKVDQSFVAKIDEVPRGQMIVAAVTNLAHVLGLRVTAEGVETERQSKAVAAIGCELAQGFFYARPMSASRIGEHLTALRTPLRLPRRAA